MKYKVGDKVRIKSIDWYNKNKDVSLIESTNSYYNFIEPMREFCGKVMTILSVNSCDYDMVEDYGNYFWTDEMIEGLAEDLLDKEIQEHQKICDEALTIKGIEPTEEVWHCPEGYQFVDENGNVINAQKIVLEKKEKRYPTTYEECCKVLGVSEQFIFTNLTDKEADIYGAFICLIRCRDAYWRIAGEEMGLEKPWEPDWKDNYQKKWTINFYQDKINITNGPNVQFILAFPSEEMRDAFYDNFKEIIENCKELL